MTAIEAAERLAVHENQWAGLSADTVKRLREVLARVSRIALSEDPQAIGALQADAAIALIFLNVDLDGAKQ